MKRFLILIIVLLFLVGCGGGEKPAVQEPEKQNVVEPEPEQPNIIEEEPIKIEKLEDNVPREYRNALKSAQNYIDIMAFSEKKLYDQLTSEYGEQDPAEAAQYAIENVIVDYNQEALEAAMQYQEIMPMSDKELFNQLTSEYGEQFTEEQAQYAIDNLPD
jgi:hypothetical protein